MLHGLGGNRQGMNLLAEQSFLAGEQYAVLTVDARGHGATGGLVTIDGPREVADVRDAFAWLAARSDVADNRIGAWGISYGGGAVWNALVGGVPFAAAETCETWTDLYSALVPQNLSKSGAVTGFLSEIPPGVLAPELETFRAWALTSSNLPALRLLSDERSALPHLSRVTTPVFMMQGRRDFAFGIDQATRAYSTLAGPKALWIGNHGHAPSTFPAVDTAPMMAAGKTWFDRYLRGLPVDTGPPVRVAREGTADAVGYSKLPATKTVKVALPGQKTIVQVTKLVRTAKPTPSALEVFGRPAVKVTATAAGGWARLVAVLTARTKAGKEIVVSVRRPAHDAGQEDVHHPHDRSGDARAQGLPLLGDGRVLLVGAEPRQPSLPRPADGGGSARDARPHDPERPRPHESDLGMKLALGAARGSRDRRPRRARRRPRRLIERDRHRRHGADLGARVRLRCGRAGSEGVLRLRER